MEHNDYSDSPFDYPHIAIAHNKTFNTYSCLICLNPHYQQNPSFEEVLVHVKEHYRITKKNKGEKKGEHSEQ